MGTETGKVVSMAHLLKAQLKSHGCTVPFDLTVDRVLPDEINQARFFRRNGCTFIPQDKHDLRAMLRTDDHVFMVHKLFTKETVYKITL